MIIDSSVVEIIWALAVLAFPVCMLIFSIIFRREIRQLLKRIGENKFGKGKSHDEPESKENYIDKITDIDHKNIDETTANYHSTEVDFFTAEVCCNKKSGKYFIVLDEISNDLATMIIPNGGRKNLKMNLFNEFEIKSINELLANKLITDEQLGSYIKYVETDADHFLNNYDPKAIVPKTGSSSEDSEPHYLKNYRNLLKSPDTWPSRMLDIIEKEQPISRKKLKDIIVAKYHYSTSDTNGSFHASLRLLLVDGYISVGGDGKISRR